MPIFSAKVGSRINRLALGDVPVSPRVKTAEKRVANARKRVTMDFRSML